ncbi:3-dehydroquinate dehydratase (3-dehydroquinase) [Podochytrium sp. JEL0797]|nr:3-dehydroquinate dehydratase (3-dehydroquinase) [Podochytrium sp. JEL0797]
MNPKAPCTTIKIADSAAPIHKVSVLGSESVTLGYGLTSHIAAQIVALAPSSTYVIGTDTNIAPLHLQTLQSALQDALTTSGSEARVLTRVIAPGESVKTRETKGLIEDFMLENKCTRDSCMIALGGGVIGDLFGFVAATFMRGIPVIQIPTTLLAMVDSSIGGKTAVDTPHGKNLVGAFHQPRHIFMDLAYLRTLPHREYINGMAEVIKTAAIWDEEDFCLLENNAEEILNLSAANKKADSELNLELLLQVVLGSIRVKAHVVTVDEKETGIRGLLNFGHSIGHAIEAILSPELLHGECVSMGMVREAEIARHLGYVNDVVIGRLVRCLQAYGLPVSTEDKKVVQLAPGKHCAVEKLLDIMRVDKKNQGNKKRVVMLAGIGKTHEPKASFIEDDLIVKILSPAVKVSGVSGEAAAREIRLNVPGSKSLSNRALVLAALGEGECRLEGLLHSDDVQVMLDSLQKLVGIKYTWEDNGNCLVVQGGAGKLQVPNSEIYLGNAGTAARFLTTLVCLIRSNDGKNTTVTGNARMKQRPIGPLVDALRSNGCDLEYLEGQGCLPLKVVPTGLKGGLIKLSASISSQYVSSILLSAPYAATPVTLELVGDAVVSRPYIDMTTAMMKSFGIHVTVDPSNENMYHIPQGVYTNPSTYLVEADASSSTYPLAFAAITGSKVTVTNIGSNSLQGDAEFAIKVLRPMGCIVEQTETQTTVQGPKRLVPIPSIDMETMTDAFLTAAVLAAVATSGQPTGPGHNATRIHGISNQRVKECNRIAAMVEQLAKFGVVASELPDGIEISGINEDPKNALKSPAGGVFCYDDHRVAMSFSILACARGAGQESVILEKKCVEKTWPAWWDVLENVLGVGVSGVDLVHDGSNVAGSKGSSKKAEGTKPVKGSFESVFDETTVVIIGMRGAGKSHMGKAAAKTLHRTFIDTDDYFAVQMGITIAEYVKQNSWEAFRKLEAAQLQDILSQHPKGYIVSCGGGIVETPAARETLKQWHVRGGRVVHLTRDIGAVVEYLTADKTRPALGEDPKTIWSRRRGWYKECSNAEFTIVADGSNASWKAVERDFGKYMRFMLSTAGTFKMSMDHLSFFLCLTFPDMHDAIKVLETASEGADALELRVDLLKEWTDEFIGTQISLIRRHSPLPIIFTVRTKSQGGRFADHALDDMFALLEIGLKHQCEFVDVEVVDPADAQFVRLYHALVANKGRSHLLASFHDFSGTAVWDQSGSGGSNLSASIAKPPVVMREKYTQLHPFGDSIKLIGKATTLSDNFSLHHFTHIIAPSLPLHPHKPLIAMNMSAVGQVSRALNEYMTPVTHPALPVAAAPGQLSIREIHETRALLGLLPSKKFYLFGYPIATSPSPTLHNAGFRALGLPYHYSVSENPNWSHVKAVLEEGVKHGSFGGASVTIPHKEEIIRHNLVARLTEAATKIGAVNTIMVDKKDGALVGDNTDWLGIRASVLKRVEVEGFEVVGAVIGAGGTSRAACFALQSLGVKEVRVWNRTEAKAGPVAKEFGGKVVSAFQDLFAIEKEVGGKPKLLVLVSCVPGASQNELPIDQMFHTANEAAPAGSMGVFVEMAYRPRQTVIIEHIGSVERTNVSWSYVEGVEVLIEQGLEQFTRWTGRRAPRKVIEEAVYTNYK